MKFNIPRVLQESDDLENFDCGEPLINEWFKKYALHNNLVNGSRTFVITNDKKEIVAFYSLAMAEINYLDADRELKKGMGRYPIPVLKLTRMGVDLRFQSLGLARSIIKTIFIKAIEISTEVAVRAVVVDPQNDKARAFYSRMQFVENSGEDKFMYIRTKEIAANL